MATIKEIAEKVGLSPSTVSIVLGGRAAKRNIPETTQNKVRKAAQELGYRPSIAARSLRRRGAEEDLQIAVFWAQDFRAPMMVRFLRGLRQAMTSCEKPIRLVVIPYINDQLCNEKALLSATDCHAAIVCNASEKDMDFLNETELLIPVVLYNRHSDKYCTVNVNDRRMGELAAQAFYSQKCRHVTVLTFSSPFPGMETRVDGFIAEAEKLGLILQSTLYCDSTMQSGYETIMSLPEEEMAEGIFCGSDAIAIGVLRALHKRGIRIPEDIRIIAVGNGDKEQEEYCIPSLSVIHLPMEAMAEECLSVLLDLMNGQISPPYSKELHFEYVPRESCGEISEQLM